MTPKTKKAIQEAAKVIFELLIQNCKNGTGNHYVFQYDDLYRASHIIANYQPTGASYQSNDAIGFAEFVSDKGVLNKLTFKEWVAKEENTTFEWADNLVNILVNVPSHGGDCNKDNYTCSLCLLEDLLSEYYKYFKS